MGVTLITHKVWRKIKIAQKKSKSRAWVAVAYFGKGAAKMLPLKAGSKLVVNASEAAVKSGQTHPIDLLTLQKRGVRIYSDPNLHGKIYVFGRVAFIGSANSSHNSANNLIEAVICTSDREIIKRSKAFVDSVAKNELGPEQLAKLQKQYRPPRFESNPQNTKTAKRSKGIRIVKLVPAKWSEQDQTEATRSEKIARRQKKRTRVWTIDTFKWSGSNPFKKYDKVMTVLRQDSQNSFASPPGNVLHIHRYPTRNGGASMITIELPEKRRRNLRSITKKLGSGATKRLNRGGKLNQEWTRRLVDLWG